MPELQTPRLRLRSFREDDLEALVQLASNEGFMRFSGSGPLDRTRALAMFERIMVPTRAGQPAPFAVVERERERLIGYCGFLRQVVDEREEMEIAYRLHPDFWNRGLASEAAQSVRDHAFRDLQLSRVISLIHPDNHASRRVAGKIGMRLEKETIFKTFPTQVFALSREDWINLHARATDEDAG